MRRARSTSVRFPSRCRVWTRSSVATLPAATFVKGQPPRPAKEDSSETAPGAERGVDVRHAGAVGVVEVAGGLDAGVEGEELSVEPFHLLGVGVPRRVGEGDRQEPGVDVGAGDVEDPLLGDEALEAAAEGGLDRDLDLPARLDRLLRRRDDPLRRLGGAHAGVLPAVGLGGRDAEADHLDAAGEGAVEPLLVQDEAGVDGVPLPLRLPAP